MKSIIKNSISILHLLLMYGIGMIGVLSNNEEVVFLFLLVMVIIKFSYYVFQRCIMTYLEDGKEYASAAQLFGFTITSQNLSDDVYEELIINFALILLLNKLLLMMIIKYYSNSFPNYLKKILKIYVYNGSKL